MNDTRMFAGLVFGLEPNVRVNGVADPLPLDVSRLAHDSSGNAHYHGVWRDLHAFLADSAGRNDGPGSHTHAVEQDGTHPDQRIRFDYRAVNDGAMADADPVADDRGKTGVGMYDRAVLDIRVLSDFDALRVAAKDDKRPHGRPIAERDFAADKRKGMNEHGMADGGWEMSDDEFLPCILALSLSRPKNCWSLHTRRSVHES